MKEEVRSSGGTNNTLDPTPAASSAGASSPAVATNLGCADWLGHGPDSKTGSLSGVGSQPPRTSLSTSAGGSALGSSQPSCRPWERGDLLRRLATFKPGNWFGKPKAASPLACARRGWINIDVDKIECATCGAILRYNGSGEVDGTCEEFSKHLDLGHKGTCPWRGNSCHESLVQFPPTPPSALIGGYKDRCDGLLQFAALPVVAASAIEKMRSSRGPQLDHFLASSINFFFSGDPSMKPENFSGVECFKEEAFCTYSRAQKLIALCGWESRWLLDIQDCEDHSAHSARNGPSKDRAHPNDSGPSKKTFSTKARKESSKIEAKGSEFKCESRSLLLDCSLCGAAVRIWDFITVSRPARVTPNGIDAPETSKKMALTRGVSAASGISGWIATTDGIEKDQNEYHDEAATTDEGKLMSNAGVDLNLTMAGGLSAGNFRVPEVSQLYLGVDLGKDLMIGQPSNSEVGDRAASYESRGPSTRKRSFDEGGSTVDRPVLRMQQDDSVEGTVIDRDGDEVDDGKQYCAGLSKRARDSDAFERDGSSFRRDPFGAGPSNYEGTTQIEADERRYEASQHGNDQAMHIPFTRCSTHASSVIAMDTVCHSADDDSMESVENYPGNVDDVSYPSTSTIKNAEVNETSELNYSNQAQQSACFQPAPTQTGAEIGVSSTNDDEVLNTDTATTQGRDGPSVGMSGGSVGMGASHEAEIHGTDIFANRSDSGAGDVEPIAEVVENQGQTGEFGPERGLRDNFVEEMDREDPNGDCGSKTIGSTKAESIESGEKNSEIQILANENSAHPSLSCNAMVYSGMEASKEEVSQGGKQSPVDECAYPESENMASDGIGARNDGSNFEGVEFDPIKHHNSYCPWVNGNVAAAGCSSSGASSSSGDVAFCGWQLTLDALEAVHSLGHTTLPPEAEAVESESAASLYKDDHLAPGRKLLARHSFSKGRGQN